MTRDPFRDAFRALQTEGSPSCPSDEDLASLVLGDAGTRRDALADHVVSCRRCAESVGILYDTHREVSGPSPRAPARRWLSVAAAAVALATLGVLLARRPDRLPSVDRGAASRSGAVVPPDRAALPESPLRLQWPARSGAETYRVKLFRDSGELVWDSGSMTSVSADLPADARERVGTGAYYWIVEIEGPLGKERSGPFSFRVGRTP